MKVRKNIVVFIDWFHPAFKAGGPIKSVLNIISNISDQCDFTVITSNKDADGAILNVEVNKEIIRDRYSIYYLNGDSVMKRIIKEVIKFKKPEIAYYNSVFSYQFTIKPLFYLQRRTNIKNIIAPRGMLGEGALALKPLKKKIFLGLAKSFLFKKIIWHTSTVQETEEVKNVIGKGATTFVAQNISLAAEKRVLKEGFKLENELKLVFISRVSEKKNLIFLLQLLSSLKELTNLKFDIFGPIEENEYWNKCLVNIVKDNRISYKGILSPDEVNEKLKEYQFYVLPSFNENYGHSIVEAINIGVPVFISDQTPWEGLEKDKVGFDLALQNNSLWQEKLKYAYSMGDDQYREWSQACYVFANRTFINKSIINRNVDLFLSN